ncbi:hypothetical protein E4M02_06435 [Brevundimonas sp. S30B]|uniref:hypothetical protein n=1 Tax=unclassified Brevundimonas TaxID=2622653 RepID=UPI0010720A40|nr:MULTISPECIES: hypothetical protein [unclassified Brevundimonas]QBX38014.1 hypothetical protein E4M01_09705 [Brevundimonas sp. MF30-B]TFW02632.1 hypothetical protein E4M02_06435 [Brevundimonas sp. S30B]
MQALIELIAGFVALLASVALSQFGVDMQTPRTPPQEVRRVEDCAGAATAPNSVPAPIEHHC